MIKQIPIIIITIFLAFLISMPVVSQNTPESDFWTSIRATISNLIGNDSRNIVTEANTESEDFDPGDIIVEQLSVSPKQDDPTLSESAPENMTTSNEETQPAEAEATAEVEATLSPSAIPQDGNSIIQSCVAQAVYITTPGVTPATIEWSMLGVNIESVESIFHDGGQPTVQYTYTEIGVYPVALLCYGPLGQLTVSNSITISGTSTSETELTTPTLVVTVIPTINPSPTTVVLTLTPEPTMSPGPSPTPVDTATPYPTQTALPTASPGPSPTSTITQTSQPPTATAVSAPECVIGVLPDLDDPLTFTFYLVGEVNTEEVLWTIEGTLRAGSIVTITFSEIGIKDVEAECIGAGGTVIRTVTLLITTGTSIVLGREEILMVTMTPIPLPTSTEPPATASPQVEPSATASPESEELVPVTDWVPIVIGEQICVDWIAYHSNQTQEMNIFRLGDLPTGETGDVNLSRSSGKGVYSLSPSISPDREWVAFISNRNGNMDIYISAVTSDDIRRVTTTLDAEVFNPVWSPDGRSLAFETNRDGNWELYLVDLGTGAFSRLTWDTGQDFNAIWLPDSRRIVFQSNRDELWQIYELTLSTQEVRRLTHSDANDYDPVFSHSGQQIAFRSTRNAVEENALYLMNADGSDITRISNPAQYVGGYSWSSDDSLIAYQSDLAGIAQIYVYEPESGETRRVTGDVNTLDTVPSFAPTWQCDQSDVVVFTSETDSDIIDIFSAVTRSLTAEAINVELEASNLTVSENEDGYPDGLAAAHGGLGREVHSVVTGIFP